MNPPNTPNNAKKLAPDFIFKDECYAIVGACFEVYKDKGCGFYEPVYQECLGIEFEYCRIPAIAQPALPLEYRGRILSQKYFADFGLLRQNNHRAKGGN